MPSALRPIVAIFLAYFGSAGGAARAREIFTRHFLPRSQADQIRGGSAPSPRNVMN